MRRILVVDDDPVQLLLTAEVARKAGFDTLTATGGEIALRLLRTDPSIAVMILDLVMPDLDGMAVMDAMRRDGIATPVIVQTAHQEFETIVSSMRNGAVDFFVKPVAPERLIVSLNTATRLGALESAVRIATARAAGAAALDDPIFAGPALHRIRDIAIKAGKSALPVLIEGEPGTGRESLARLVHSLSDRATRPFVAINGAAFALSVLREADGGTLYLSEIGILPPDAQEVLHNVLAGGRIDPSDRRSERFNIRLIAATSARLLHLTQSGSFREDLFYRLNVLPAYLPPLRDRRDDLSSLAAHFVARSAAETGRRVSSLSAPAQALLAGYDWPGNLGQFESILHRAVILAQGDTIEPADLPQLLSRALGRDAAAIVTAAQPLPSAPVHIDAASPVRHETASGPDRFLGDKGEIAALPDVERALIVFALDRYNGRMSQIARALRIGRSTLYRKLREYGLDAGLDRDAA
ncbi:MAG: sigma-54 dependent transcriptional regulator [Devosia sp.]